MILRLQNVECGEVEISLHWIDLPGSKGLWFYYEMFIYKHLHLYLYIYKINYAFNYMVLWSMTSFNKLCMTLFMSFYLYPDCNVFSTVDKFLFSCLDIHIVFFFFHMLLN
jgi:hypothetical protein